jgi:hypothetical protein
MFARFRSACFSVIAAAVRLADAASGVIGAKNIRRDKPQALNTLSL